MKNDANFWIAASHGYFVNQDPAVFGVRESRISLSGIIRNAVGRENGTVAMNGLITAGALALARGTFHYHVVRELRDGVRTIWAEYAPENLPGAKDEAPLYLMRISQKETSGVKYSYMRTNEVLMSKLDRSDGSFASVFSDAEFKSAEYIPYLYIIPEMIAGYALDPDVSIHIDNLCHMPEKKYDGDVNLYWLSDWFFRKRSEYYSTAGDVSPLPEDVIADFTGGLLNTFRDWELYSFYHSEEGMVMGSISTDRMASVFAADEVLPELKELIPDLDMGNYYLDPKVKAVSDLIVLEKDAAIPITTGMFYGPPASGKSTAVKLMAQMFRLPYVPVTFNSNITMDDLLGSWQPASDGTIHFVDSLFVKAYQSPSVVEFVECYYVKPGSCGDLNTALDETAQITLPDGRIIHRHPHCYIIATINAGENEQDYRAVREQDASFDRRFEGFKEYLEPFDRQVFASLIRRQSGFDDDTEIMLMIRAMNDINKKANETGDWQTVYPSSIIRWAQHRKYKDIFNAASSTVLPAASKNLDIQSEIRETILRKYW